tara:strand:+ start:7171 stop:7701 length:531 start_codon:yes stop_codon:yes gene_type:complete
MILEFFDYFSAWATNPLGRSHVLAAILALMAGPILFLSLKGTIKHKWLGYFYVVAMLLVNGTALSHYTLTGTFNLFHFFAIFSAATIIPATWFIWRAKKTGSKNSYMGHAIMMSWSYFGLFAALISETATRQFPYLFSGETIWSRFLVFLFIFLTIGAWWTHRMINKNVPRILENY